jgi:hypothetical protein
LLHSVPNFSVRSAVVPKETADVPVLALPPEPDFANQQLKLFQTFLCNTPEQNDQLSNAIELWDSVPRYSVNRKAMSKSRINGQFLEKHTIDFQHRGQTYTCIVSPARVTDEDGVEREYYPSVTEELVEDALRKIAAEEDAGYFSKAQHRSGVVFTLHQLRQEMARRGHTRSYPEIVQALNILSHAKIEIKPHGGGESTIVSACLPSLVAVSRKKLKDDPDSKWAVQFHPLVTTAIEKVGHRQYNYHLMMSHTLQLTRWLHKQLALKFNGADLGSVFRMKYSTIKRDSGLLEGYKRERDAIDGLQTSFQELQKNNVILSFDREDERGPRKKLLDVTFVVRPSQDFVREAKAANKRQQIVKDRLLVTPAKR